MNYTIYRNGFEVHTMRPDGRQEREIMVKDQVNLTFSSGTPIHLYVGDYIDVWDERYELYKYADVTKESSMDYEYSCMFVAQYYKLAKWKFRGYDSANQLTLPDWEITTDLQTLAEIVVANANRLDSGWTLGDIEPDTLPTFLQFTSENNLLLTLDQIARAFKTEWWVVGKVIHFIKRSEKSGHEFQYGYDKGLDGGLRRYNLSEGEPFSRLFVQGSEQNIPASYRNGQTRLQLPIGTPFLQGTKYGPDEIEADVVFDDIRPERIGTITATADSLSFVDTGIDFDINLQLLPGLTPKVSFLTGSLAGQNFEIAKGGYNHGTHKIRIIKNELEKGRILPTDDLKPEVGDTYFIFDIEMPASYILAKEQELLAAGQAHLAKNGAPKFAYEVPPDHFFFERNSTLLTLGDTVHVKELDLLLNKDIRIVGYTRDLHDEFRYYSMQLSDFANGAPINRVYAEAEKTKKALVASKVYDIQRARNNWKTTNELTNLLDTLRAEMLLITLEGAAYSTDIISTFDVSEFSTTAGQIIHEQYTDGAQKGIWNVPPFVAALVGSGAKYVYVRANDDENSAIIVLSDTKIGVNDTPGVYHFPFGIISSIVDGTRLFTSLRGYTKVTGGQIGTGIIVANNGNSWINLDEGTFNFENLLAKIAFTEDGVVLDGRIVATNAEFIGLIVKSLRTNDTGERIDIDEATNSLTFYNSSNQMIFQIANGKVIMSSTAGDSFFSAIKTVSGNDIGAAIGLGIPITLFGLDASATGVFKNRTTTPGKDNIGVYIDVANASVNNYALMIKNGVLFLDGGASVLVNDGGTLKPGLTYQNDVRMGGGEFIRMKWVNGILVSAVLAP